jgi:hypothetical protein
MFGHTGPAQGCHRAVVQTAQCAFGGDRSGGVRLMPAVVQRRRSALQGCLSTTYARHGRVKRRCCCGGDARNGRTVRRRSLFTSPQPRYPAYNVPSRHFHMVWANGGILCRRSSQLSHPRHQPRFDAKTWRPVPSAYHPPPHGRSHRLASDAH